MAAAFAAGYRAIPLGGARRMATRADRNGSPGRADTLIIAMRRHPHGLSLLIWLAATTSCAEDTLNRGLPCDGDGGCPAGLSCLVGTCVPNGALGLHETCTQESQCADGLVCVDFVCVYGCRDLYHLGNCPEGQWCRPVLSAWEPPSEERLPVGLCTDSECDPETTLECTRGQACVAISQQVGGCIAPCQYGFDAAGYHDTCANIEGVGHGCEPLGVRDQPVCIPDGVQDLAVGEPGCDSGVRPCPSGSACVDVVCRQLCTPGQADPCPQGEACVPVHNRTDVHYCQAG